MQRRKFRREFKIEAVRLVRGRGSDVPGHRRPRERRSQMGEGIWRGSEAGVCRCQEPSWLENIELGAKKAIKRENIDPKIFSRLMALLRRLRSSQAVSHTHLDALGSSRIVSSQRRCGRCRSFATSTKSAGQKIFSAHRHC
jgi:hypothetical protein